MRGLHKDRLTEGMELASGPEEETTLRHEVRPEWQRMQAQQTKPEHHAPEAQEGAGLHMVVPVRRRHEAHWWSPMVDARRAQNVRKIRPQCWEEYVAENMRTNIIVSTMLALALHVCYNRRIGMAVCVKPNGRKECRTNARAFKGTRVL